VPGEIRKRAADLGVAAAVTFLRDLGDEDLLDLYDSAEIFVSLSWRESFGLSALEALSRGLRVVVSSWGASAEVVGAAGVLVDPRDSEAAARQILEMIARPRTDADVSARVAHARRFSWEHCADLTLDVYRDLLERRSKQ
jgi:glycosyltransferase involved in cell wall biosynthesis